MTSNKKREISSCNELDSIAPITRVIVFQKEEILLNKIVSKKSRLKDIFISNNLDPNGNYLYEGSPLDINKTILDLLPYDAEQLTEIKLFIQSIKLDLQEDNKEIYFSPILKPFENPFRILVFSPEDFTTSFKKYPLITLKHYRLDNFSDTASAYCNTDKGLYISGGKNKGKGMKDFLKICKFKLSINILPEIPIRKEYHSMIFIPKNYIYFIGGNSKDTFYYDINTNIFNNWAPLKHDKISPALALVNNRYIYAITEQKNKKRNDFIEKTDLTKYPQWEKINVRLIEPFPMHNFGAAVGNDGRIYFLGGRREKGEKIYCYNTIKNIIEPCGQENSSLKISDKTFYFLNEYNSALIPNELREDIQIVLFNRKKNKFRKVHYEKDLNEIIELNNITNDNKEENKGMKIYYKKIPLGKMPHISERLLKLPKLDELKKQIGKNINISIEPSEIKIPENETKKEELNIKENINIDVQIPVPNINLRSKSKLNTLTKTREPNSFIREILSAPIETPIVLKNNRYGLAKINIKRAVMNKKGKNKKVSIKKEIKKGIDIIDINKPKIEINKLNTGINKAKIETSELGKKEIDINLNAKVPEFNSPSSEDKSVKALKKQNIDMKTVFKKPLIDLNKKGSKDIKKRNKISLREILSENINNEIVINKKPHKYPNFGLEIGDKEYGKNKNIISKKIIHIRKGSNKEINIPETNKDLKKDIDINIPNIKISNINIKEPKIEFPFNISKIEENSYFNIKEPEIDLFNEKEDENRKRKETLKLMLSKDIKEPIYTKKKKVKMPNINLDIEYSKDMEGILDLNIPEINKDKTEIKVKEPIITVPAINISINSAIISSY